MGGSFFASKSGSGFDELASKAIRGNLDVLP